MYVDIGNSRIKLARRVGDSTYEDETWEMTASWDRHDPLAIQQLAKLLKNESPITGVSVVRELSEKLEALLAGKIKWVYSGQIPPDRSRYYDVTSLGTDRFLLADAAWRASGCEANVVVIGAGTACTLDLMNHEGIHQGGAILPGMGPLQKAFEWSMPGLPLVEASIPENWPGRSTREGIQWGQAGLLRAALQERLAESIRFFTEVSGGSIDLTITGGDAEWIQFILDGTPKEIRTVSMDPWLLFKGLEASKLW